jgi:hypothetical protein
MAVEPLLRRHSGALASAGLVVTWSSGFVGAELSARAGVAPLTVLGWRFVLLTCVLTVLGLAGVVLVVSGDLGSRGAPTWAFALPAAGMASLATGTVLTRRLRPTETLLQSITMQAVVTVAVTMTAAALTGHRPTGAPGRLGGGRSHCRMWPQSRPLAWRCRPPPAQMRAGSTAWARAAPSTRNSAPATPASSSDRPWRDVVMNRVSPPGPPSVHELTCAAGTSTTSSRRPSGAKRRTADPPQHATQT